MRNVFGNSMVDNNVTAKETSRGVDFAGIKIILDVLLDIDLKSIYSVV